jgi:iron-sulfur cluster assembly accessory protein
MNNMNISVTPRASEELRKAVEQFQAQEENIPNAVRVFVAHKCGCGSAQFGMGFDEPEPDDNRIDVSGVTLLVDPDAAPLLQDAQVDYSDDLMQHGFLINTPNVGGGGGCGCGGHGHGHEGHSHA